MITSPHELRYFLELTQALNFSRASERIGISQPSLSAAIKRLEHAVGTELFIRGKNGVSLTQAGKRLLSHTKQLIQMWQTAKSESLASHNEIQGSFVLGCPAPVALYSLPSFLPKLLIDYPKLEINLKHDLSRNLLEGIINLSIDIGILVNPIRHPDLVIHKLDEDKMTFWRLISPTKCQTLNSDESVLIYHPDLMQTEYLLKRLHRDGVKFKRIIKTSNLEVVANLTASGCGIGLLPTCIALSQHSKVLEPIAKMPSYTDEVCLVYRSEQRHIKAMEVMIKAIKMNLKK